MKTAVVVVIMFGKTNICDVIRNCERLALHKPE